MGAWFSNLGQNISDNFNSWKEEKTREREGRAKEKEEQKRKEEEEKQKQQEKEDSNKSQISDIADNVNGVVSDKFKAFYSLKDFLSEFWDAIFEADAEIPEFNVTLPEFCGGGTYNVLDLRFYNQYRSYIHGIIAGICYFVYIKRIYQSLPNVIR